MKGLPPPKPIPLKDRASLVFVERAQLDVLDGAFVAVNSDGTRTHIPVGGLAGLMLEPGELPRPGCGGGWRPGCWRSGPASLSATTRPERGSGSGNRLWPISKAATP